MCLHRERGSAFHAEEVAFTQRIAPHLADGLRLGLLAQGIESAQVADTPGLVLLAADGSVISNNSAADQWLEELTTSSTSGIPVEVHALAARLRALDSSSNAPQIRTRTRAGRWAACTHHGCPTRAATLSP